MMDEFEKKIADVITKKLEDGVVERLVEERLEECIKDSLKDIFSWNGAGKELIKKKLSETMVPVIESHDFNQYLTKMDTILTEIINQTTLADNKRILENFQGLMKEPDKKEIKLSEIFDVYQKYVAQCVDTSDLEAHQEGDEDPYYDYVTTSVEAEFRDRKWYSSSRYEYCDLDFKCEEDEHLNRQIKLYKLNTDAAWKILTGVLDTDFSSISSLNDFDILMMNIKRSYCRIVIDKEEIEEGIEPEEKPEWSLS